MIAYRAAAGAALAAVLAGPAAGAEVTLAARDGALQVSGELLDFDGEFYRIDSVYGELTLDATGVICTGPGCPAPGSYVAEFMVSGAAVSGAVLMPALVEAFAEERGYATRREIEDDAHFTYVLSDAAAGTEAARIRFRVSSSAEGFADLLAEQADIALSFREIAPEERARALEAGLGDLAAPARSRVLALDALVPIVAPDNPVRSIALGDLARALSGAAETWAALGGGEAPVAVHLPAAGQGLAGAIEARVLGPARLEAAAGATRHAEVADLADAVAGDPFAIGVVPLSEIGAARPLALRGSCGALARAGVAAVKAEDYPLTAPHFIYTPARRLPRVAREFLRFVQSETAQEVIRELGFVDQSLDREPLRVQGRRLARAIVAAGPEVGLGELRRMAERLLDAERLSVTFRFRDGSAELDAQSRANVALLAEAIETGTFDGRTLVFAGFSDGVGAAAANRRLSARRAEAVMEAVRAAAVAADASRIALEAEGFGEAMPMACDEDAWGRQVNRRVEVWLR